MKPLILDNRIRQQSNNVLEIANVRQGDEGIYQCFIYNSEESAQGSSTVIIQGKLAYFVIIEIKNVKLLGKYCTSSLLKYIYIFFNF